MARRSQSVNSVHRRPIPVFVLAPSLASPLVDLQNGAVAEAGGLDLELVRDRSGCGCETTDSEPCPQRTHSDKHDPGPTHDDLSQAENGDHSDLQGVQGLIVVGMQFA